ncbi:MAG: 2-oxo acid dehydrogenase subunit E2 [Anaerolineae bacterium]|nr:2-oxo acid dehydrogenase subunit E2 [Anaerolineae bacterium]
MLKEIVIPVLDQTTEEVTLVSWLVSEGEQVRQGQTICEIETDKANAEIEATAAGILRKQLIAAGTPIPPLTVVALVGGADEPIPEIDPFYRTPRAAPVSVPAMAASVVVEQPSASENGADRVAISPRARRLAQEHSIDPATLRGSGPNGRIIEEDVEAAIQAQKQAAPSPSKAERTAQARAARVAESWREIPHFYTSITIDLSGVDTLRQQGQTYTDFFAVGIARALRDNPQVNGIWQQDAAQLSETLNLGIVVQAERGLVIPILHKVNERTLAEIAVERTQLVAQAREGKLAAAALSGATFTLSNMGAGHIDGFTAIISPPQLAILSVGSVMTRPLVVKGELVIRPTAIFTLGADHRAIDGRQSAAFLEALKVALEEYPGQ